MTPDEMSALLDAATPQPWEVPPDGGADSIWQDGDWRADFARTEDAQCAAALRNLAPLLLDLWRAAAVADVALDDMRLNVKTAADLSRWVERVLTALTGQRDALRALAEQPGPGGTA